MEDINVNKTNDTKYGWLFSVTIGDNEYEVELNSNYWNKLTDEEMTPEELVYKSFKFLLERESADAILTSFNLKEINKYFPEYEDEILKIG